MKFGCCINFDKYDILVDIGFDFIELSGAVIHDLDEFEFSNINGIIGNNKVKCCGFNSQQNYIDKVVNRGAILGIDTIGFGSPLSRSIPTGFSNEQAMEQLVDFIEMLCQKAEPYGIKVLLEPLSKIETNFVNSIDEALRFLELINSNNKGLLIDYYHFSLENEDINRLDNEVAKHLFHVHIAESKNRSYLIKSNISLYKQFINKLKYIGYYGKISVEANYSNYEQDASLSLAILRGIDGEQNGKG
jgi:sugar phosphate isomerase/epimerase